MHPTQFSFGDNVQVCDVVITRDLALAGLKGEVFGVTTPSVTGVEVIGALTADVAINVHFPSLDKALWFVPELLEFLDHGAGTVITIGTHKLVRNSDGSWFEEKTGLTFKDPAQAHPVYQRFTKPSRPWWKFW
jgi:hypothetical protein